MSEVLHPEEVVTTFFLVRHGDTKQTEEGKLYTDPEATLTEKGREQMEAVAEWLHSEEPQILLSGSSKRARSSAEILSQRLGLPLHLVDTMNAWQVGEWEGRSYLDVKKSEPDVYHKWVADPLRNAPPGGESIEDVYRRTSQSIRALVAQHEGGKAVLVSHAEVVRALLVDALGMPLENYWRLSVPTGSIARVDYSAHFATIHYVSLRPHIHANRR